MVQNPPTSTPILRPISQTHTYIFPAFAFFFPRHPESVLPPSISSTLPVMCALPMLLKKSTRPPKSLGFPIRPVGWPDTSVSMYLSRPKLVMREGKTPGQMTLTMMFLGASLEACILVRWMQAALEGPSDCKSQ